VSIRFTKIAPDQRYSDRRKVEKLLKASIHCTGDPELIAAKVLMEQSQCGDTTSLTLVATFHSKFQESTDQPSLSTDKPNPVIAAFMPLIDRQAASDGDEAAMVEDAAEVARRSGEGRGRQENDSGGRGWRT
jgi:hypothetical protein